MSVGGNAPQPQGLPPGIAKKMNAAGGKGVGLPPGIAKKFGGAAAAGAPTPQQGQQPVVGAPQQAPRIPAAQILGQPMIQAAPPGGLPQVIPQAGILPGGVQRVPQAQPQFVPTAGLNQAIFSSPQATGLPAFGQPVPGQPILGAAGFSGAPPINPGANLLNPPNILAGVPEAFATGNPLAGPLQLVDNINANAFAAVRAAQLI